MGKLRILGSGTSTGVPEIGCTCPVCTSTDPRDNRLRASSLLHTDDAVILIDCGPDFREQMLRASSFEKIDGVLVTHEHYDHVGGLDDLRPFGRFADIPIYSDAYTAAHLPAFFYEKMCAHRKNAEKSEESACSETARVMARCQSDNAGHPVKEKRENDAGD